MVCRELVIEPLHSGNENQKCFSRQRHGSSSECSIEVMTWTSSDKSFRNLKYKRQCFRPDVYKWILVPLATSWSPRIQENLLKLYGAFSEFIGNSLQFRSLIQPAHLLLDFSCCACVCFRFLEPIGAFSPSLLVFQHKRTWQRNVVRISNASNGLQRADPSSVLCSCMLALVADHISIMWLPRPNSKQHIIIWHWIYLIHIQIWHRPHFVNLNPMRTL